MYVWTFDINGLCFHGRTWDEYINLIWRLDKILYLTAKNINLIIYVHNLGYEFQFIRKLFSWDSVFARETRKPLKAQSGQIIYNCSYMLSGY